MPFIQIIDFRTSDIDAVNAAEDEWQKATEGKRTVRRQITARDRNDPTRYLEIVFFDSYESAMENSNLPETQAAAQKFTAAADGPLTFSDLDVVDDRS